METKKTKRASLENKRTLFFQCGLLIVLTALLLAFEWASPKAEPQFAINNTDDYFIAELDIPITKKEIKRPPLPALPPIKITTNVIDIDEFDIDIDVDVDDNFAIDFVLFEPNDEPYEKELFVWVADQMPKFNGGDINNFRNYIQSKLSYPETALEIGLSGTVYIVFMVDKQGEVQDVKIHRGVDPLLDNEVLRAMKSTPKWDPGKQRGNPVNVMFSMPVEFRIN